MKMSSFWPRLIYRQSSIVQTDVNEIVQTDVNENELVLAEMNLPILIDNMNLPKMVHMDRNYVDHLGKMLIKHEPAS